VFPDTVQPAEADAAVFGGGGARSDAEASPLPDAAASCIDTVVLPALADTYISADYRDTNYGTDEDMIVGRPQANQDERLLVDFDLSGVAWSEQVVAMRIVLTHASDASGGRLGLYAVAAPWEENEATWFAASATSSWSTSGGDIASGPVATATVPRTARRGDELSWSIPTIRTGTTSSTSVTNTTTTGQRPGFGWLIQSEGDGPPCAFTTREGTTGSAPRLEVDLRTCQ
jgi:hypothetical protein